MVDLSKTACPVLAIMRRRAGIHIQIPDDQQKKIEETGLPTPDHINSFREPAETNAQRAISKYWDWGYWS